MKKEVVVGLMAVLLNPALGFARFDRNNQRSINGTADTLRQGNGEVGLASFSYGITDDAEASIPTLPLLLGVFQVDGRYKFDLDRQTRITPGISIGTSFQEIGAIGGLDFGHGRAHNMNVGFGIRRGLVFSNLDDDLANDGVSGADNTKSKYKTTTEVSGTWRVEYDYYTDSRNLFFVGAVSALGLPYLGFTWAWENVHIGLMGIVPIPLPLPYIYLRF